MQTKHKQTLAASLIALMAAAPAFAQQSDDAPQSPQTGATAATGEAQTGLASDSTSAEEQSGSETQKMAGTDDAGSDDGEMPQAATPEGQGLSDIADVDQQYQQNDATAGQQGGTVMLDLDAFAEAIYERGFRQGYFNGLADAREHVMEQIQQSRAIREGAQAQRQVMESAIGGQRPPMPDQMQSGRSQQAGGAGGAGNDETDGTRRNMASNRAGERGAIIVLPPGMSPEAFVQRMVEMHNQAMGGN